LPYTSNPHAPKARIRARNDVVWRGFTIQQAADKYGVNRTTVWRWVKRAERLNINGNSMIDTLPSRPKHHPKQLPENVVNRILELRKQLKRCAPVLQAHLKQEGVIVSLSSVKRTLKRHHLIRKKKPATFYIPLPRPTVESPGSLVQVDTIHYVKNDHTRFYIFCLIDTYTRLAYAEYHPKLSQQISLQVIKNAQKKFGFPFQMIQTDSGPEFRDWLLIRLKRERIALRHSRVRKPNDNAHIERFNRTIQEECFDSRLPDLKTIKKQIEDYIEYYNNFRLHLSLDLTTPAAFVAKVLN